VRSSLFRDVTHCKLVGGYQRFDTPYWSHLQGTRFKVHEEATERSKTEYKVKCCRKIAGNQINTDCVSIRVISSWTAGPSKRGLIHVQKVVTELQFYAALMPKRAQPLPVSSYIHLKKNYRELNPVPGHAVAQCLRHCATNRKVAGSIPDGVTEIFH
jgi:hypothetical protein